MNYLLDTNTCIYMMKNHPPVVEHYKTNKHLGIAVSTITAAELYFGVFNSVSPEKNGANLVKFLIGLEILEFDDSAAIEYGRIRAVLRRQGTPISPMDMLIAAHAKSQELVVVTNNVQEFARIEGLELENWV